MRLPLTRYLHHYINQGLSRRQNQLVGNRMRNVDDVSSMQKYVFPMGYRIAAYFLRAHRVYEASTQHQGGSSRDHKKHVVRFLMQLTAAALGPDGNQGRIVKPLLGNSGSRGRLRGLLFQSFGNCKNMLFVSDRSSELCAQRGVGQRTDHYKARNN